ncbi:hypothetical protein GLAREA_09102 [Glarea lozoyensis ATCC 20868]|uniref:Nephrocystin 3-like N-terminal domain-containing protein n=1 Tax=Glarea lozoyensis (strain ATCC 20868 / MF5171) TaxID=1116229 RepID=S3DIF4_GLAL2|nr:uncharacterized protein GLAREA_09102 [Glarea lozoyensis ATCC 20868]EPE36939.1 hypothetical protein GLAREA_09102 [Glarea lozoyensis ATCC 20868]
MDGLSAAASVIAVLDAAKTVISICSDYASALRNELWSLPKLLLELRSLRSVLEHLFIVVESDENSRYRQLSSTLTRGALELCKAELQQLAHKLEPPSWAGKERSKRRALIIATGWPLKEKDTRKCLDNLGRLRKKPENRAKGSRGGYRNQCLTHPQTSTTRAQSAVAKPAIGSSKVQILSSTTVQNVLEQHQASSGTRCVAYFYFDFADKDKQKHQKMLQSLAIQLLLQAPRTPDVLKSVFDKCLRGLRQPSTQEILHIIRSLIELSDDTFILLDALDECEEWIELLEDLEVMESWHLDNLHILVTSRKEYQIEQTMLRLAGEAIISLEDSVIDGDIQIYVYERLLSDQRLRRWRNRPDIQAEISSTLITNCGEMFRRVVCQMDALKDCLSPSALRNTLSSLPKTLDATYDRILSRIDPEQHHQTQHILHCLAYSTRPLHLEEVADISTIDSNCFLRVDPDKKPLDVLEIPVIALDLARVKTVQASNSKNKPHIGKLEVSLAHFSVKEYLSSSRIQLGRWNSLHITEPQAHATLMEVSLAMLLHCSRNFKDTIIEEFPFVKYAADHWIYYARHPSRNASRADRLCPEAVFGSEVDLINWMRILSRNNQLPCDRKQISYLGNLAVALQAERELALPMTIKSITNTVLQEYAIERSSGYHGKQYPKSIRPEVKGLLRQSSQPPTSKPPNPITSPQEIFAVLTSDDPIRPSFRSAQFPFVDQQAIQIAPAVAKLEVLPSSSFELRKLLNILMSDSVGKVTDEEILKTVDLLLSKYKVFCFIIKEEQYKYGSVGSETSFITKSQELQSLIQSTRVEIISKLAQDSNSLYFQFVESQLGSQEVFLEEILKDKVSSHINDLTLQEKIRSIIKKEKRLIGIDMFSQFTKDQRASGFPGRRYPELPQTTCHTIKQYYVIKFQWKRRRANFIGEEGCG